MNSENLKKLLVVFHSASGNTQKMTDAVIRGINKTGAKPQSWSAVTALQATPDDVLSANGIILLTPENVGYMSGAMKVFFDRSYYPCLEKTQGMPYALVIRAGNDGEGAKQSITRIVTGLAWREIAPPIISRGEFDDTILSECEDLGESFSAGLDAGIF